MSVAYALHKMFREEKRIVMVKPTYLIGGKSNAIGMGEG